MKLNKSFLVVLLAGLSFNSYAHRTWLLPSATFVDTKEPWVTIDAAVSENLFDFDTNAMKLDGLIVTAPDGSHIKPDNQFTGRLRSSFDLKLAKPGTYKVSVVTEGVMASYKLNGEQKRWRGTEEAFAKEIPAGAQEVKATRLHNRQETFVTAVKPDNAVFKSSGVGLELEPITHPNDLRTGEKARLRFLLDGKPAANLAFSLIPGGVRYRGVLNEIRLTTDENGAASIDLPEAGMYWVNATYPPNVQAPAGSPPQQPARRVSYAATLEVLPQ